MSSTTWPVTIGTHDYTIELRGFTRQPIASVRQMQDSSREPSDRSLDNPGIWKRDRSDFIQGAGQQYLDQEDEADPRRFRTSKGIDVWERRQLTLLPDVSLAASPAGATTGASVIAGDYLYMAAGAIVYRSDGTTWTLCTGLAGTVTGLTAIGGHVYAACGGSGLRRVAAGGTAFAVFGGSQPDTVGVGGGRLVAADANVLFEVTNVGGAVIIYTHFDVGFTWNKIISAPNGIYCIGRDATRSTVWLLTVVEASGALAAPYPALQMEDGEFINDVLFYGGVLVLATNQGVRLASINGSGFLTYGPLIEIGDVLCLATDGTDVWFGWSNFDGVSTGLGRIRPSRFTETFTPAYASDLMATGQGVIRTVASYNGRRFFLQQEGGGTGRIRAQHPTDKVASGSLWTGGISYGTPEAMGAQSIEGQWDALPAGASVTIELLDGLGGAVLGTLLNTTATSRKARADLVTVPRFDEGEIKVTLTRGTTPSQAPVVRRWTLRSVLLAYRTEEIVLPVRIFESNRHDEAGRGKTQTLVPIDEYVYLYGLMKTRQIVDLRMGSRTEKVLVDAISIGPDVQDAGGVSWTKQQDWLQGTWAVRLLTVDVT